jgi:ATP-binding cassette subfamily A (ABC1) protein 3
MLGIVPQKNVLFPTLTCIQTLRVWQAIKWSNKSSPNQEDLYSILRDCDLAEKADECAGTLSGGQKRKLQLAIGLVGGSTSSFPYCHFVHILHADLHGPVVLVDECTSGVDPLSRRALWKTLTACREDRCIVFTTHVGVLIHTSKT